MYHIAICDDEPDFVAGIADQIRTLTAQSNIPCRISTYFEPAQLYDALCASQDEIHLVLLDILMGEGDGGMRLAARLREMGNQVSIILVSSSPDFIWQGYDVQAIKYLLKPVSSEDLRAAVLYDYRNHYKKRYLGLKIGSTVHSLSLWKIDCFEIKGKQVAVWHQGGVHYYRGKISELEPLLPSEFFRCHQSFIINLDNVVRLVRYRAYLEDGREVPVSQRHFRETQQAFLKNLRARFSIFQNDTAPSAQQPPDTTAKAD